MLTLTNLISLFKYFLTQNGEYYGYKLGWPDFFNTSPVGIEEDYSIDRFRDGGKTKEELDIAFDKIIDEIFGDCLCFNKQSK